MQRRIGCSALSFALAAACIAAPMPLAAQCSNATPLPCIHSGPVDTNAFVILPFVVRGPAEAQYLRESMVDLLQMALDGVGKVSVRYPPTALRRLSLLPDPTDFASASSVARGLGAGRLIGGSVITTGQDLAVRLEVYDVERGKIQYFVQGRGVLGALNPTVDSLAARVLARKIVPADRSKRINLDDYTSKSPGAIQAFTIAMQHVRRAERRTAADSLKSAIRQDSSFGLAWYWLAQVEGSAVGSTGIPGSVPAIIRAAQPYVSHFPERIRYLITMFDANTSGDRLRILSVADQAGARFPNDADIAFQRADKYFHFGLNIGTSRDRVVALFRRAIDLDDENPELLEHYGTLMMEAHDTTSALQVMKHCQALAPALCADWNVRVLYRGERLWATQSPDSVLRPNVFLLRAAPDLSRAIAMTDSCYIAVLRGNPLVPARVDALLLRSNMAAVRGQYELARLFLDSAAAISANTNAINALTVLTGVLSGARNEEALLAIKRVPNPSLALRSMRAWHASEFFSPDSAETEIAQLESMAWPDSALGISIAAGFRGIVALRQGDTTRARALLVRAYSGHNRRVPNNRLLWPGAYFSLVTARLEAARGNWEAARRYLADLYPTSDAAFWIIEGDELQGRVLLALGDSAGARDAFRNVTEVWKDADAVRQPRVTAAREALAKLERR